MSVVTRVTHVFMCDGDGCGQTSPSVTRNGWSKYVGKVDRATRHFCPRCTLRRVDWRWVELRAAALRVLEGYTPGVRLFTSSARSGWFARRRGDWEAMPGHLDDPSEWMAGWYAGEIDLGSYHHGADDAGWRPNPTAPRPPRFSIGRPRVQRTR